MSASPSHPHTGEPAGGAQPAAVVELEAGDLAAFCPNPKMPVWNSHPRVYLDAVHAGGQLCPYCGTLYRLKPGTVVKGHH